MGHLRRNRAGARRAISTVRQRLPCVDRHHRWSDWPVYSFQARRPSDEDVARTPTAATTL